MNRRDSKGRFIKKYNCSFCRKSDKETKILIQGDNNSYICEKCVSICVDMVVNEFIKFKTK